LLCNGAAISRSGFAALFGVLGTTYGPGDGSTTFSLPDLAGRQPLGADPTFPLGSTGGNAGATGIPVGTTRLSVAQTPAHTHTMPHAHSINHDHGAVNTTSVGNHAHTINTRKGEGTANVAQEGGGSQSGQVSTGNDGGAHAHTVNLPNFGGSSGGASVSTTSSVGGGQVVPTMDPYTAVSFIIKT